MPVRALELRGLRSGSLENRLAGVQGTGHTRQPGMTPFSSRFAGARPDDDSIERDRLRARMTARFVDDMQAPMRLGRYVLGEPLGVERWGPFTGPSTSSSIARSRSRSYGSRRSRCARLGRWLVFPTRTWSRSTTSVCTRAESSSRWSSCPGRRWRSGPGASHRGPAASTP